MMGDLGPKNRGQDRVFVDGARRIREQKFVPFAYAIRDGQIRKFEGKNIRGFLKLDAPPGSSARNGRSYHLHTMPYVEFVVLYECIENGRICGKSYTQIANCNNTSVDTIKMLVHIFHPIGAHLLDKAEREELGEEILTGRQ